MEFKATKGAGPDGPPIDWPAWKAEVLARLDVAAEYAALGVEFVRPGPNGKGVRECHAFGREDAEPSAFVNVRTGVYHDSGGEGLSTDLFGFALRHGGGRWGKWIEVARHYAEKAGVPLGHVTFSSRGKILEAIYRYHDADGTLLFGVHRYRLPNGDKTFRQYPWRDGEWFKGERPMDGVKLVPYRLPELMAQDGESPVWVVEGEKDADRLAALGLVATCSPMGAGKWREEYSAYFAGWDCYVLPDNDPPGRAHAVKVAASLAEVASVVKVVELPGLSYKGDVSDWLDAGGTVDELGHLAWQAPEWAPPAEGGEQAEDPDLTRDATLADLRPLLSADAWAWPLWIPMSALTLIASEPGTGKTRTCLDLARRVYHGLLWPDGTPMPDSLAGGKTLWVVADNQWREICNCAGTFAIPDDRIVLNSTAADPYGGTSLQEPEELADFEARICRVKPALVVIDTITNTADFKSQDSSDAKKQYKPLQDIAVRCHVAILCITHLNSGGKVLGRRATEKCRVVIQMSLPDPDGQPNRRKLWVEKSFDIKPPALGVTMGDEGSEYDLTPPVAPSAERMGGATTGPLPEKTVKAMDWLARRLAKGMTKVGLLRRESEAEGISTGTLYRAKDNIGAREEEIDGYKWWSIPATEPQNGHTNGTPF